MPGFAIHMPPTMNPGRPSGPPPGPPPGPQEPPPLTLKFPHVFVFPRDRIDDPSSNVLLVANMAQFAIGSDRLLADHRAFLRTVVMPMMAAIPTAGARMIGLASRSGNAQFNLQLGLRRAKNAKRELEFHLLPYELMNPPGPPPRITVGSQGEFFAARQGVADGKEDGRHRSVLVTVLFDRRRPTEVTLRKSR